MRAASTIPYTHWACFDDEATATACGKELDYRFDCLSAIDAPESDDDAWLLRAARPVSLSANWHDDIAEVVTRHGGRYDGGEACVYVAPSTGPAEPTIRQAAAAPATSALAGATWSLENARDGHIAACANALWNVGVTVWKIEQEFFCRMHADEEYCQTRMMVTHASVQYALTLDDDGSGWSLQFVGADGDWHSFDLSGTLNPFKSAEQVAAWAIKEIRYHVAANGTVEG